MVLFLTCFSRTEHGMFLRAIDGIQLPLLVEYETTFCLIVRHLRRITIRQPLRLQQFVGDVMSVRVEPDAIPYIAQVERLRRMPAIYVCTA